MPYAPLRGALFRYHLSACLDELILGAPDVKDILLFILLELPLDHLGLCLGFLKLQTIRRIVEFQKYIANFHDAPLVNTQHFDDP